MTAPPDRCPLCHGARLRLHAENADFLFGTTDRRFQVFECRECAGGFIHPEPDAELLAAAYPDAYWWVTGDGSAGVAARLERRYREWVLGHHVHVARSCLSGGGARLLDIGCGSGTFLHLMAALPGVTAAGLDQSPAAAEAIGRRYGLPVTVGDIAGAEFPDGSFDLVTLFHVLEHLPQPAAALAKVRRWLSPGGVVLVQVPNFGSWQRHLLGRRWTGLDIPRHLRHFAPGTLSAMLRQAGFAPRRPRFFSLRDNAPAIVSSLLPRLDPVAARVRGASGPSLRRDALYFALVLLAQPLAGLEAACGRGGTMFVAAFKNPSPGE